MYEQTYIRNIIIFHPLGTYLVLPKYCFTDKLRKDLQDCRLNFRKPFILCPTYTVQDLILFKVLSTSKSIFTLWIMSGQHSLSLGTHMIQHTELVQNAKRLFTTPVERVLLQAKHPKVSLNQHLHHLLKNQEKTGNWNRPFACLFEAGLFSRVYHLFFL